MDSTSLPPLILAGIGVGTILILTIKALKVLFICLCGKEAADRNVELGLETCPPSVSRYRSPVPPSVYIESESTGCNCTGNITGFVKYVGDGDGFDMAHTCPGSSSSVNVKVRIAGIDSPEKEKKGVWGAQPFSNESKLHLMRLLRDKTVQVEKLGKDQYGRDLGMVQQGSVNVNAEMVARGLAWVYTGKDAKYGRIEKELLRLENEARREKRGLWVEDNPISPMEWKKIHRAKL